MSADRDMVESVLQRAPGAFAALVSRHQKLVWHLLYRMVQDPEDTRELCQEVFLRVHRQLQQFRFDSALATWIGRIAFNAGSRHLRRKQLPLVAAEDHQDNPAERVADTFDLEAACADSELLERMGDAISALPPLQRTVVTLYHLEELGVAEVASITALPAGTVKSHLFRARAQLRRTLEALTGDPQ